MSRTTTLIISHSYPGHMGTALDALYFIKGMVYSEHPCLLTINIK